jgi:hypothetical protein
MKLSAKGGNLDQVILEIYSIFDMLIEIMYIFFTTHEEKQTSVFCLQYIQKAS